MKYAYLLPLLAVLSACASVSTNYSTPPVQMPGHWENARAAANDPGKRDQWWRNFNDPALDQLIASALERNNDLAIAALAVRRAQLQAGLVDVGAHPGVNLDASSSASRNLSGQQSISRSQSITGSASYEVDLWNRLGKQGDAARREVMASAEDRESVALALIGTTARLYWQIAFLNQRIAISEHSLAQVRKTLKMVQQQYEAGAASGLEPLEAQGRLVQQEAAHTQLLQDRVDARNALAILFDAPPNQMHAERSALPDTPLPEVDAGLPAALLARRPDLRAAEQRLRKLLIETDIAAVNYYPKLTLSGSLGSTSNALAELLKNPIGTLGANLALPFLQWNEMRLHREISQVDYQRELLRFRQTWYQALADVENALSNRTQLEMRAQKLRQARDTALKVERLYEERYRAGAVALKIWLDAQEASRSAEIALAVSTHERLGNYIALYQALGGDAQAVSVQ